MTKTMGLRFWLAAAMALGAAGCGDKQNSFLRPAAGPESMDRLTRLQALFDAGDYTRAIRKAKGMFGEPSPVGEKARLLCAESYLRLPDLYEAYCAYDDLIDQYPYHPSMEQVGERLYTMATQAHEKGKSHIRKHLFWSVSVRKILERALFAAPYGEFADRTRLMLGDLAFEEKEYDEAAHWYEELSSLQAASPWASQALLKGARARLKNYAGPTYDATNLVEAEKLALKCRRLFPDRDLPQVESVLGEIRVLQAERDRKVAGFYRWRGYRDAEHVYRQAAREEQGKE